MIQINSYKLHNWAIIAKNCLIYIKINKKILRSWSKVPLFLLMIHQIFSLYYLSQAILFLSRKGTLKIIHQLEYLNYFHFRLVFMYCVLSSGNLYWCSIYEWMTVTRVVFYSLHIVFWQKKHINLIVSQHRKGLKMPEWDIKNLFCYFFFSKRTNLANLL